MNLTKEDAENCLIALAEQAKSLRGKASRLETTQTILLNRLAEEKTKAPEPAPQTSEWCRFDTVVPPGDRWLLDINTRSLVSWVVLHHPDGKLTDPRDFEHRFINSDVLYLVLPALP